MKDIGSASHKPLQLLWTDPQEMPGRGPSKRVRFPLTSIFVWTDSDNIARVLALPLAQM